MGGTNKPREEMRQGEAKKKKSGRCQHKSSREVNQLVFVCLRLVREGYEVVPTLETAQDLQERNSERSDSKTEDEDEENMQVSAETGKVCSFSLFLTCCTCSNSSAVSRAVLIRAYSCCELAATSRWRGARAKAGMMYW